MVLQIQELEVKASNPGGCWDFLFILNSTLVRGSRTRSRLNNLILKITNARDILQARMIETRKYGANKKFVEYVEFFLLPT